MRPERVLIWLWAAPWLEAARIGVSRKFGYVDFESAEDLEKALELTDLKVFGNEIKLEKPEGKDSKKD